MTDWTERYLAPDTSPSLRALARAALAGGAISRSALRKVAARNMTLKAPRDYQTETDVAVERTLVAHLAADFPDLPIRGEEGADDRTGVSGESRMIVIDPIDGTTNFAWGIPHFGLTITIVDGQTPLLGVVYDAMADELFSAEAGCGAHRNGARMACASEANMADTLIGAGLPLPGQVRSVPEAVYHRALRRLMDTTAGVRRLGSSALSTAYVACGRLDGFFEDGLSLHDYAAATLMVREAGGIVSGFDGKPLTARGNVMCGSPAVHRWLLEGFAA